MAESATILLPDISGYTESLTKTELEHSSHIINELLEAILAANNGEFVLSEVEGDALLLYHKGKPKQGIAGHMVEIVALSWIAKPCGRSSRSRSVSPPPARGA